MRGEESAVHGGDDGEESDLFRQRLPFLGGEEGGGEPAPYLVGVEGEHELDGAAGEERRENGVYCAVNVVEG